MSKEMQCPACGNWGGNHMPLADYFCVSKALDRSREHVEALKEALGVIRRKAFDYLKSVDLQKGRISVEGVAFLYDIMRDATTALKDGGIKE